MIKGLVDIDFEAGGNLAHRHCDEGTSGLGECVEKWMWEEFDAFKADLELFFSSPVCSKKGLVFTYAP